MTTATMSTHSHFPINSDSEFDNSETTRGSFPSYAQPTSKVPLNSESEDSDSPSTPANSYEGERGRGRQPPPVINHQFDGTSPDSDADDTLPPLSAKTTYTSARSRSRTPRGNKPSSRSRSRSALRNGGERVTVRMLNSESEDQSSASDAFDSDGQASTIAPLGPAYIAQNSGSDTDGDVAPAPVASMRSLQIQDNGSEQKRVKSRSRSRGRVPRVEAPLNSGSEEDEIEISESSDAAAARTQKNRGDGGEMRRVLQNEESENGF